MPIQLPTERCYYFPSRNERDHLLCWLPKAEVDALFSAQEIAANGWDVLADGVEVVVDDDLLRRLKVRLGRRELMGALAEHLTGDKQAAAVVEAEELEVLAESRRPKPRVTTGPRALPRVNLTTAARLTRKKLRAPRMSPGDEALRFLAKARR